MTYELNQTIPFMQWHWGNHAAHTVGLSREQRGLLDEVRIALWSVAGVRMLRADLMERLNLSDEAALNALLRRGILVQDAEGWLSDQVLSHQYAEAVRKGAVSRANGSKGGRPKQSAAVPDPQDF
jgi:hypothetical protein